MDVSFFEDQAYFPMVDLQGKKSHNKDQLWQMNNSLPLPILNNTNKWFNQSNSQVMDTSLMQGYESKKQV